MMGNHAPAVGISRKYVGSECTEVRCGALYYTGNPFDTSDEAEFALYDHVQVTDLELHQSSVLKDPFPTHAN